jgi:RNA polymerase sigma-70 factor, ECF subfamily
VDEKRRQFDAEVLPHLDAAYRFARWLCRSATDAEDLVQDAMLRAFRGFDGLRGAEAKPWLLAIVRNCYFTARQRSKRFWWVPLPTDHDSLDDAAMIAATPTPEDEFMRVDEQRALAALIARLPAEQREVLVLREIEDMDYRQIADVTQAPIGTVMSRLSRARAALKVLAQAELSGRSA